MRALTGVIALTGVAALLAGCNGHKRADPERLQRLETVAIVARVQSGPSVLVAQVAPELASPPGVDGEESDRRLARQLGSQMRRYEMGERLRAALSRRLPAEPPWNRALPAVEVATALESLLVEDKAAELDYAALQRRGADSLLEIVVSDFGVKHAGGRTGLYWEATGRLLALESDSVLWRASLSYDETRDPGGEPRDLADLRGEGFRDAVLEMVGRIAEDAARDLAPGSEGQSAATAAAEGE